MGYTEASTEIRNEGDLAGLDRRARTSIASSSLLGYGVSEII